MSAIRNFVLGLIVGAALVVPTTLAAPDENALEAFASTRAQIEAQVATAAVALVDDAARWIVRQISGR
jgi:hypothetical protein